MQMVCSEVAHSGYSSDIVFSPSPVNGTYIGTAQRALCLVGIVEYLGELFSPP